MRPVPRSASAAPVAAAMLPPTMPKQPISAVVEIDHVHRAGAAAVDAGRAAEQLGEQRLRARARGRAVAVAAVGAGDAIAGSERAREADRDRLLPGVEVRRAVDLAAQEERLDEVLDAADHAHPPVEVEVSSGRRRAIARQLPSVADVGLGIQSPPIRAPACAVRAAQDVVARLDRQAPHARRVDAEQLAVALHDLAVDEDRVDEARDGRCRRTAPIGLFSGVIPKESARTGSRRRACPGVRLPILVVEAAGARALDRRELEHVAAGELASSSTDGSPALARALVVEAALRCRSWRASCRTGGRRWSSRRRSRGSAGCPRRAGARWRASRGPSAARCRARSRRVHAGVGHHRQLVVGERVAVDEGHRRPEQAVARASCGDRPALAPLAVADVAA